MYQDPSAPQYPYQPQPGAAPQQPPYGAPSYPQQYPYQPQSGSTYYPPQPTPAPYPQQHPYAPQPNPAPYPQQYPYAPQSAPAPYPQHYPPVPPPGPVPYPHQHQPYYPYSPQQPVVTQSNPRANRALINGIISIVLSFITLFALVGYAGLITGTFAIIYGFIGLNTAKRLQGGMGRGQAVAGIVLGFAAWFLVIISFIVRAAIHRY